MVDPSSLMSDLTAVSQAMWTSSVNKRTISKLVLDMLDQLRTHLNKSSSLITLSV